MKELRGPSAKLISDTQDTNKNGNGKSNARKKSERKRERGRGRQDEKSVTTMDSYLSGSSLHERTIMSGHANLCVTEEGGEGGRAGENRRDTRQSRIPQYLLRERDLAHLPWPRAAPSKTRPGQARPEQSRPDQTRRGSRHRAHPETTQRMLHSLRCLKVCKMFC